MKLGRWTIEKRPRGFEIHYTDKNGREYASYPVVKLWVRHPWVYYPYILRNSIQAINEHRAVFEGIPFDG